ncbi:MAG: class I SAM-dependent rRNA methyltransferase [Deltaproteobacteria bacterium]|nr:class I SAM-dependent rRNA methyltransferase [Deltaproteobacteria bacterium]
MKRLRLAKDITRHILTGHPWVYRHALAPDGRRLAAGDEVLVEDPRGRPLARGFFDPDSPIAVRVMSRDPDQALDDEWLERRVGSAVALRKAAATHLDSDGVRLIHGEGDFCPGLVVDLYVSLAVVRFDGSAARAFWRPRLSQVLALAASGGVPVERAWARPDEGKGARTAHGEALLGEEPKEPVVIREGNAQFEVDVVHGQKTGFFLDQRDNRLLVHKLAAGARVLNLFAYTGGFSVAAALGGARQVTTVDVARPAIEVARRNLARNEIPLAGQELVIADALEFLEGAMERRRKWDMVICDPPSFAPSEKAKPRALLAYRQLARAAASVARQGGLLCTASCSSHVTADDFWAQVALGVSETGRTARVLDVRGAGVDHPVPPSFPEGRYLKFLLVHLT